MSSVNTTVESLLAHQDWVRQLARSLVRDPDRAEDVAQTALLEAVTKSPRDARNPRGWLFQVVRNAARSVGRSEQRRRRREERAARREPADAVDPAESAHRAHEIEDPRDPVYEVDTAAVEIALYGADGSLVERQPVRLVWRELTRIGL